MRHCCILRCVLQFAYCVVLVINYHLFSMSLAARIGINTKRLLTKLENVYNSCALYSPDELPQSKTVLKLTPADMSNEEANEAHNKVSSTRSKMDFFGKNDLREKNESSEAEDRKTETAEISGVSCGVGITGKVRLDRADEMDKKDKVHNDSTSADIVLCDGENSRKEKPTRQQVCYQPRLSKCSTLKNGQNEMDKVETDNKKTKNDELIQKTELLTVKKAKTKSKNKKTKNKSSNNTKKRSCDFLF